MQRFRATLAYNGTAYSGFQRQAGGAPTIQGALEAALRQITGQEIAVLGAGRTDAGVHASGQVIAFDVDWRHPASSLMLAMNANLPTDIALQDIAPAAPDFHPRYSARSRTYVYRFYQRPLRQPLWDNAMWHIHVALDGDVMQRAAALLVGQHDFATFGGPMYPGGSTIRRVMRSELAFAGEQGAYTITADAFLQRMVRAIMGTLAAVGRGAMTLEAFEAAFRAADRGLSAPPAPSRGLTLVAVDY